MGIVNVTPDSFYDGGGLNSESDLLIKVEKHINEGASIIDIGGYSSRPGADDVEESEELDRVIPAIKSILKQFPDVIISLDTFRSKIAREGINEGVAIINDISGGKLDDKMYEVVADNSTAYIIMHMPGTPQTMQDNISYNDVTTDITKYFSEIVEKLKSYSINDVILDPGFGFGKTLENNYELLKNLSHFKMFSLPILVGISRKSMICNALNVDPENALNGTTAAHTIALMNGANILRVHDVKEAVEAIKIVRQMEKL
ncbi:MAG: dihydropteroate synthase [Bacteroidetes bacterium]|nr:MAG: dihydropteroate synthase [Bacteroidota bacterium]